MANMWRRVATPYATVMWNPAVYAEVMKTNAYNQRINDAINNPNVFTFVGTEPSNRQRVYIGTPTDDGEWINVVDALTQKQWFFPNTYSDTIDWHLTYFENKDTIQKINDRYKNKRNKTMSRIRAGLFKNIYNPEWLTLWQLTERDILNPKNDG